MSLFRDCAQLQFGAKGDVAIRRRPDGSLGVDSKYLRVRDFMIGDVLIDDYIEKIIRKRELRMFELLEKRTIFNCNARCGRHRAAHPKL